MKEYDSTSIFLKITGLVMPMLLMGLLAMAAPPEGEKESSGETMGSDAPGAKTEKVIVARKKMSAHGEKSAHDDEASTIKVKKVVLEGALEDIEKELEEVMSGLKEELEGLDIELENIMKHIRENIDMELEEVVDGVTKKVKVITEDLDGGAMKEIEIMVKEILDGKDKDGGTHQGHQKMIMIHNDGDLMKVRTDDKKNQKIVITSEDGKKVETGEEVIIIKKLKDKEEKEMKVIVIDKTKEEEQKD